MPVWRTDLEVCVRLRIRLDGVSPYQTAIAKVVGRATLCGAARCFRKAWARLAAKRLQNITRLFLKLDGLKPSSLRG